MRAAVENLITNKALLQGLSKTLVQGTSTLLRDHNLTKHYKPGLGLIIFKNLPSTTKEFIQSTMLASKLDIHDPKNDAVLYALQFSLAKEISKVTEIDKTVSLDELHRTIKAFEKVELPTPHLSEQLQVIAESNTETTVKVLLTETKGVQEEIAALKNEFKTLDIKKMSPAERAQTVKKAITLATKAEKQTKAGKELKVEQKDVDKVFADHAKEGRSSKLTVMRHLGLNPSHNTLENAPARAKKVWQKEPSLLMKTINRIKMGIDQLLAPPVSSRPQEAKQLQGVPLNQVPVTARKDISISRMSLKDEVGMVYKSLNINQRKQMPLFSLDKQPGTSKGMSM